MNSIPRVTLLLLCISGLGAAAQATRATPVWGTAAISYILDGRQWVVTPAGLELKAFALPK
jgi:hypothetical protein